MLSFRGRLFFWQLQAQGGCKVSCRPRQALLGPIGRQQALHQVEVHADRLQASPPLLL